MATARSTAVVWLAVLYHAVDVRVAHYGTRGRQERGTKHGSSRNTAGWTPYCCTRFKIGPPLRKRERYAEIFRKIEIRGVVILNIV